MVAPLTYREFDPDDSFLIYLTGMELAHRTSAIDRANTRLDDALGRGDSADVFFYLEAVLSNAAAIARLLWPAADPNDPDPAKSAAAARHLARGKLLRRAFKAHHARVLKLELRSVRNAYEHFDEQLDDYLAAGETVVADRNIGPLATSLVARPLRHYDPATGMASILDVETSVPAIVEGAHALRANLVGVTFMLDEFLRISP